MNNIITDVSTVTTIPEVALQNLNDIYQEAIAYCVLENMHDNNPITEVDIGLGILYIKLQDENVFYKFVPSNQLEQKVTATVTGDYFPIAGKVERRLRKKILNVYKELM